MNAYDLELPEEIPAPHERVWLRRLRLQLLAVAVLLLPSLAPGTAEPSGAAPPSGVSERSIERMHRAIEAAEYEASENDRGLQAPNRRHSLRTYFEPSGVRLVERTTVTGQSVLSMGWSGMGRGDSLRRVPPGVVVPDGERVEIRREGGVEWYVNSPAGLEQGFTLRDRPEGEGPLVIELRVDHARATLRSDGSLLLISQTGRRIEYGKLAAWDAEGQSLPASLVVPGPERLRIEVEDRGATWPITIDPLFTASEDALIEADQELAGLGSSVAGAGDVNGDGFDDVIVGAPRYDAGEEDEGAAFVFMGGEGGIAGVSVANAAARLEANQVDARLGRSVAGAGDVNGDGYDDVIVGADFYDAGQVNEGAALIFLGGPSGIASGGPSMANTLLVSSQAYAYLGRSVAGAGDVNGDGYDDVIAGSVYYDGPTYHEGAAFVFLGGPAGVADAGAASAHAHLRSAQSSSLFGTSVAAAGDVNGDGYDDVIVGASGYDSGELNEGAAFVFLGSSVGISDSTPDGAGMRFQSNQASAQLGLSVGGAGDVNGDGYADVIVGAHGYGGGGAAFVFLGNTLGVANGHPLNASARLEAGALRIQMGKAVAGAGDVNGDGYDDVIVGAPSYDGEFVNQGAGFVFTGGPEGVAHATWAQAAARITGASTSAQAGTSVAGAGDVDGDGFDDSIVGAPLLDAGEIDEGAAIVSLGGREGIPSAMAEDAVAWLVPELEGSLLGYSVAAAGDVNADGYDDVVVGAPGYDAGGSSAGAAFLFLGSACAIGDGGPASAATRLLSSQPGSMFGTSVSGAGDLDADGFDDVVIGAPQFSAGQAEEGVAFVFLGAPGGIPDASAIDSPIWLQLDQAYAQVGASVSGAGDVNADGYDDLLVGAPSYSMGESEEGAALLYLGGPAGLAGSPSPLPDAILQGDQDDAGAGHSVAGAGDLDADGYDDFAVGAPGFSAGQGEEGVAFVFLGGSGGVSSGSVMNTLIWLQIDRASAAFGASLAAAGDVNADGYDDLLVGAPLYQTAEVSGGVAVLYHGGPLGLSGGYSPQPAATLESDQAGAWLGASVAGAGDLNGDGYDDVLVGAPRYGASGQAEGAAFVYLGTSAGIAGGPITNANARLESGTPEATFGWSVAGVGDVDADGFADALVAAPGYDADPPHADASGLVALFRGNGNATVPPSCDPNVEDRDTDGVDDDVDNCIDQPNGPLAGSCVAGDPLLRLAPCLQDQQCGAGGVCSGAQEDDDGNGIGLACDPIELPEPGRGALLVAGISLLACLARRRARRR